MKNKAVLIEIIESTAIITFNRPERYNAVNHDLIEGINHAFSVVKNNDKIRAVVLTGNGKGFCAGADLNRKQEESNVPRIEGSDDISMSIRHLYKPVICKIQGSVHAGALLMVTNCTHAIAVENAKFSAPEILRGVWPHMVMAGLFRVMPKRAGLDFCMRGQAIDAKKAEEWGLINESVPNDQLDERVDSLASDLANLAPGTMQFGLEAYVNQDGMNFDEALPYLGKKSAETFAGPDAQEGISAFLEKREPKWD